jgi:hypothetical protein
MPKALVPTSLLSVDFEPTGKRSGDQYFNTVTKLLYIYDGTVWNAVSGGGGLTAVDGGGPTSSTDSFLDGGQP